MQKIEKPVFNYLIIRYISVVFIISTLALFLYNCTNANQYNKEKEEIYDLLQTQKNDWNRGDLRAYMLGYLDSDSLMFIGKKRITYGWQQTLDNYRKTYPDKATMGHLTFDIVKIDIITQNDAFVIGKWILKQEENEAVSGHFTLRLKKLSGQWKIIADHSS